MNALVVGVAVYIVLQFGIGVWVSRRVKTETDYLLAGRGLGVVLASFSIFATWFGAETVIGAAGVVYDEGLAGCSADPFGYVLCIFVMGALFAVPLWRGGYTTFADLFRQRYSPTVERCVIAFILPSSVIWAAAQIRAFGQVLSSTAQIRMEVAIIVATTLVIGYTVVGGLLADAWTDLIQGVVLILGLLAIGTAVFWQAPAGTLAASMTVQRLLPIDGKLSWLEVAESWTVPVLGSLFAVELISRVLGCRTAATARNACFVGGAVYLALGLVPVLIGLMGPSLMPDLAEPEQLIPELARSHLGSFFFILFSGALISAILSTVDSALLASSALVSHNLLKPVLPDVTERGQVKVARLCVAAFGLIAFTLAMNGHTIERLVALSSAFGGAGFAVVAIFAIYSDRGGPVAAISTILVGLIAWSIGKYCGWTAPYVSSLPVSLATYLAVALWEDRPA